MIEKLKDWFWYLPLLALPSIIVGAFLLLAACGEEDETGIGADAGEDTGAIESVVRSFYDAVLDGDLDRMEGLVSTQMDSERRALLLRAFSVWQQASDSEKDAMRIGDLFVRQENGTAEVDVTFKAGNPDTLFLSLQDSHWRIVDIQTHQ